MYFSLLHRDCKFHAASQVLMAIDELLFISTGAASGRLFFLSVRGVQCSGGASRATRNKNKPNLSIDSPGNQIDIRTRHRRSLRYESDNFPQMLPVEFVARLTNLPNSAVSNTIFIMAWREIFLVRKRVTLLLYSYM